MSETPGQNGQPSATQQDLDVCPSPSRVNEQKKIIGGKFAYELSTDGKPKNKFVASNDSKDGLFIGTLVENGSPCVIRRYDTNDSDAKNFMRDLEALQTKKNLHENFIRYFGKVEVGVHTYYAFEKCRYSVEEVIRNEKTETLYAHVWKTLSREKIMHQTTLGLDYLHGLGFIHRNIHARNVLLAEIASGSNTHYVVKLSDFRFGKPVQKDAQNSLTKSTSGWIAPEMNDPKAMLGPWADVFILGCFFHYVSSGGHHPFGRNIDQPNRETNIGNPEYKPNWAQHTDDKKAMVEKYLELMKGMTSFDARDRPTTGQILRHFDTKEYYDMYPTVTASTTRPGLCVIFHQDHFHHATNLLGYRKDVKSLCETFWLFGYDLRIYADLTGKELLQTVKSLAEENKPNGDSIFKGYASLVVCILSHGGPGTVEGIDGQPVNVSELQWAFSRETCPDLQDKAKIFFIQACQGNKGQNRKEYSSIESRVIYKKLLVTLQRHEEAVAGKAAADVPVTNESLNNSFDYETKQLGADVKNTATMMKAQFSDVVTMWATIVDYASYVYPDTGSSFIQSLCCHLVNSQGGTRITGGDRIRDLHDAHLAITQEVSSQPIYVGSRLVREFDLETGQIYEYNKYEHVNQTPLYQSTACGKKVGFQVVAKENRCKRMYCYGANENYVLNIFDNSSASSTPAASDVLGAFRVILGANNDEALDLVLYPHTTSAHTVIPMEFE